MGRIHTEPWGIRENHPISSDVGEFLNKIDNPEVLRDVEIAKLALETISEDTFLEYSLAFDDLKSEQRVIDGNKVIFLLLSNTFNRADSKIEVATDRSTEKGNENIGQILLDGVLNKAKMATHDGKRISPTEMFSVAKNLANYFGIETAEWNHLISEIIKNQSYGMEAIKKLRETGEMYDLNFAVRYRLQTIGNYAKLLSTCVSVDNKDRFLRRIMEGQIQDDLDDVVQDFYTQVNPFVVLCNRYNCKYTELRNRNMPLEEFINLNLSLSDFGKFTIDIRSVEQEYYKYVATTN